MQYNRDGFISPLDVISEVRAVMPQIESQLPPGLKVTIAYDATRFIQASIDEVVKTLAEAVVIVIVVVAAHSATHTLSLSLSFSAPPKPPVLAPKESSLQVGC